MQFLKNIELSLLQELTITKEEIQESLFGENIRLKICKNFY